MCLDRAVCADIYFCMVALLVSILNYEKNIQTNFL